MGLLMSKFSMALVFKFLYLKKKLYLPNLLIEVQYVVILALVLDTGLKFYVVQSQPA